MRELSPPGGSEREGELAQRAKRDRPGAYGACDDEGRGLLDAPPVRADEDIGPYGWQRTGIFVGAAPCGRPRAHAVCPYGNTHHRRARPLGAPRPAGSSGPTEYAPCRAFVMRVGAHLCVRPEGVGGHAGPPLQAGTGRTFCRGGPMWPPAKPSPHRGEGGPKGRMRGRTRETSPPWAPSSVSLRSTASPCKGEAFFVGRDDSARPALAPAEVVRCHENAPL